MLRLLAAGRSNDEIATKLVLSVRTVERHVGSIYEKIDAHGQGARAAAAAYALRRGLVDATQNPITGPHPRPLPQRGVGQRPRYPSG